MTKVCSLCNKKKINSSFSKNRNRCKECIKLYQRQYHKQWRENNKEKIISYKKNYYKQNKEKILLQSKKYRNDNVDKIAQYKILWAKRNKTYIKNYKKTYYILNKKSIAKKQKEYYKSNKFKIKKRNCKYYNLHKCKIKIVRHVYYVKNKQSILVKNNQRKKIKLKNDIEFKLRKCISELVRNALKSSGNSKRGDSSIMHLNYSISQLREHLENQFESWMSWDNYGVYKINEWDDNDPSTWKWQIDHIIPQSKLKYSSIDDELFKRCWSLDNLRPLNAKKNLLKGNRDG